MAKRGWQHKTTFNQKKFDQICALLRTGKTLRAVCRGEDMPSESTVRTWVYMGSGDIDQPKIHAQYWESRKIGMWAMVDETIEIADNAADDLVERERKDGSTYTTVDYEVVARSALRVKQRNWLAERILRSDLGEKSAPPDENKEIRITGGLPED